MDGGNLVQRVWTETFERPVPECDAERALLRHLQTLADENNGKVLSEALRSLLKREIEAKVIYTRAAWGYFEAANIVAKVDECIIALQEKRNREFLDPLSWDLLPHPAIIATVEAVLLLFNIPVPAPSAKEDLEAKWRNVWGLWIVKNIDAHAGGWEWVATNEPMGLFTKPYCLSPDHLDRIEQLLETAFSTPASHRCWHRMQAYTSLRDWTAACVKYVHMMHHCLPTFPAYTDIQKLVTPPQRTPQANVWFRLESPEGVEYFYNRLLLSVTLEKPSDFDGANVTSIPGVIQELIQDALQNDVVMRLELEKRSRQRAREKLLAEDEWIECLDYTTQTHFYYSLTHYRIVWTPPANGAFISSAESVAFAAVLRLQAAYRKRRLERKLHVKRTKRSSLPVFSAFSRDKQSKFYS